MTIKYTFFHFIPEEYEKSLLKAQFTQKKLIYSFTQPKLPSSAEDKERFLEECQTDLTP